MSLLGTHTVQTTSRAIRTCDSAVAALVDLGGYANKLVEKDAQVQVLPQRPTVANPKLVTITTADHHLQIWDVSLAMKTPRRGRVITTATI